LIGVDLGAGAQHFDKTQAKRANETLVDHVDRGDVHPQAAVFAGQVVFLHPRSGVETSIDWNRTIHDALCQGRKFVGC